MLFRTLAIIALLTPISCNAATSTWEAFDFKNCHHWEITDDFNCQDKDTCKVAKKYEENLNRALKEPKWQVLWGFRVYEDKEDLYGVCSTTESKNDKQIITCKEGVKFPLAGATFSEIQRQVFKCTNGCKDIAFPYLYEKGYEDGGDSIQWKRAAKEFESKCNEKQRAKEFHKRMSSTYK